MTPPREGNDRVTFSVPRTHLYAAFGLVVGFAAGAGLTGLLVRSGGLRAATTGAPSEAAAPPAAREPTPAAPKVVATEGRPSWGRPDARVTIVEFTDYQCPFCRQHFAQTLGPLRRLLADSVRYVVRNYPIPSLHPEAEAAAVAAECAFEQGKFWEYHDRLFEVTAHDAAALRKYARDLKLDVGKFDDCVGSPAAAARVRRDVDDGVALGVQGTPAFFINGRMIEGAVPLAVFALAVQKALMESAK